MPKKKAVDNTETIETKEAVQEETKQESSDLVQGEPEQENENSVQGEPEQESEDSVQGEQEQESEDSVQGEQEQESQDAAQKEPAAEEQVLFCVTPKEKKVALRSTPEFRMDNKNLAGMVDENSETRVFKVVEVENGYGRLLYPAGMWIALNACNRI